MLIKEMCKNQLRQSGVFLWFILDIRHPHRSHNIHPSLIQTGSQCRQRSTRGNPLKWMSGTLQIWSGHDAVLGNYTTIRSHLVKLSGFCFQNTWEKYVRETIDNNSERLTFLKGNRLFSGIGLHHKQPTHTKPHPNKKGCSLQGIVDITN